MIRRGDRGLALLAAVIAAGCLAAGIWQLRRLAARRARNAVAAARLAEAPLVLTSGRIAPDSTRLRRVSARGVFDYAHERVWAYRSFDGTPGVALVTPLRFGDGSTVLVDRGWVPSPDALHVDAAGYRESDTVAIEGVVVDVPKRETDSIRVLVQQEAPAPPLPLGLPRRWPAPALDNGPHLSYAIQWFSFAVIIGVGTTALLRRRHASDAAHASQVGPATTI